MILLINGEPLWSEKVKLRTCQFAGEFPFSRAIKDFTAQFATIYTVVENLDRVSWREETKLCF